MRILLIAEHDETERGFNLQTSFLQIVFFCFAYMVMHLQKNTELKGARIHLGHLEEHFINASNIYKRLLQARTNGPKTYHHR